MTTFRVGQRVKLVRPLHPENLGKIGTIVELEFLPRGTPLLDGPSECDTDCHVLFDGKQVRAAQPFWSIEPLTDSYDLVSWESMRDLWVPEHLREVA